MRTDTTDFLTTDTQTTSVLVRRIMWIVWPSFLMAGVLEILVFAMVDPQDMHWFGQSVQLSRQGVYTVAFFAFWLVTMLSSALTALLAIPSSEVDH
jgi:uncharacterized membrane protein YcfT